MKLLFINPPNAPYSSPSILIEPIDILTLATFLQYQGHEVRVIDMDIKRQSVRELSRQLDSFKPHCVILVEDYHIPLHSSDCLPEIVSMAEEVKKHGARTVIVGKPATYSVEKLFYDKSPFDVGISGEAEVPLMKLFGKRTWHWSQLKQIPGLIYFDKTIKTTGRGEKIELNQLPIPNRNLVDLHDYIEVRTMLTSRGCPMHCAFCFTPDYWGKWRSRAAQNVVDEIKMLVDKYQTRKIMFLDDNATVDKKRMQEISKLIIDQKIQITLGCLGHINAYDEETMKLMYEAGFRFIHYGIESGNDGMLAKVCKNIYREKITDVIRKTKMLGFRVRGSFILDLPDTTSEALTDTLSLIEELEPHEVRLHYFTLRAGSQYYRELQQEKSDTLQNIHSNTPINSYSKIPNNVLVQQVNRFTRKMEQKDYLLFTSSSQIGDHQEILNNPSQKIMSLCALRYGIGWRL